MLHVRDAADVARRHFYGACAVGLGVWETAAYVGVLPTITATMRRHPRLRPLIILWIVGLAVHLCTDEEA